MLRHLTKLAPWSGRVLAGQLLVVCGVFIGIVLAGAATWYSIGTRQNVIAAATREMSNDALMLAEQEDRLLQAVQGVQLGLIEHMRAIGIDSPRKFEQLMASREVHENLRDRIAGLAYIAALALADQHGVLLNFSRAWPPPQVNAADQDYVRELTGAGAPPIFVSAPSRGTMTGKWVIYLSRRYETEDGRLIGFVLSTIQTEYFEHFFARLPLTGGGSFALFRRDGMLLVRYPHSDSEMGKTFAGTQNFGRLFGALEDGVVRQAGRVDGIDRLIVPQAMADFPLIIAVSDTTQSILRGWNAELRILITTTALLELMIAGTILLAVRQLRSHARLQAAESARGRAEADLALAEAGLALAGEREGAARTLHLYEQRFDTAVQNMAQGLLMVDHEQKILVVNRRFCELWGLSPDSVVPGMGYAEMTRVVTTSGNIRPEDMAEIRRIREGRNTRSSFVWELSDGRAFTVTHQPMEEGWLTTYEDVTDRRAAEARIEHQARHDALTNLPNRVLFRETLEYALAFARRGHMLALHFLDLDQFKAVNDTLGHPIGDGLLQAVAQRLRDGLRDTDTVARLGGDEFAIVQTAIDSPLDATSLASKLNALIEAPYEIDGHLIVIGTSIGIAFAPRDGVDADQLLKCADLALYRAKLDGRGLYRLFEAEMDAAMQARRTLELDLRQALSNQELEVFYQPLIDVRSRQVAGCEALLRWRHKAKGLVPPDQFIPLAEETGLIMPIGEWVLREACATAVSWPVNLKVAVNLSVVQFSNHDLVGAVVAALRESGLHPSRLELEITESVMLRDTDAILTTLHQLRELGVRIALDDFGTGYSSLTYLRRFPFDRIKIDQSFISVLGTADDCMAIVRAVVALGHDLGMAITAEGVETPRQAAALELAGCTELQGFLFSRPVPASTLTGLLRSMPGLEEVWPADGDPARSRPERALSVDRPRVRAQLAQAE